MPLRRLTEFALAALVCLSGGGLLLAGAAPSGIETRDAGLRACEAALSSARFAVQSVAIRSRAASGCEELAAAVLRDAPSHGLAHLVLARAALAQDEPARAAAHLAASQRFAPWEGWLAERRFLVMWDPDAAASLPLLRADLDVLLSTAPGAALLAATLTRSLAERRAEAAPLREMALEAAGRAKPADRQRFLTILRGMRAAR